jgi:hypothetical protein
VPVPTGYPSGLPGVPVPNFTCTRELFRADGLTLTTSTNTVTAATVNQVNGVATGVIDVSGIGNGLLVVNTLAVSGTATPTLSVFVDVEDSFGNWTLVSSSTSIGGTSITGTGVVSGVISANTVAAFSGRIRWTVSGTNPSFSCSFDLFGR